MTHRQSTTAENPSRDGVPEGNIGATLSVTSRLHGDCLAVAAPDGRGSYRTVTFRKLEVLSNRIASGLNHLGLAPGHRIVLMVPPGIEFFAICFALFKLGAVVVLIDPGMGIRRLTGCLVDIEPRGFIAGPTVHFVRRLLAGRFRQAQVHVAVGWATGTGAMSLDQVCAQGAPQWSAHASDWSDPAAIIFTTGSTGPPKGVLYRHGHFAHQIQQLRDGYSIEPGEVDLPGFPLFGLFNAAMGVTTVVPDMNPTRPATVDPRRIVRAARDWKVTQAFGSPAMWNVVGRYCDREQVRIPTIRRILSAGAPVPVHVLQRMQGAIADNGEVYTPYGATEALPVASISATELLEQTTARSAEGAGTCVGRRFSGIRWQVIRITDDPIDKASDMEILEPGNVGELVVQGPVVTDSYVTGTLANRLSKIPAEDGFWHRMGDVGYLDDADRFWFCGRKAHRVQTEWGDMFTVPCEAIVNQHPHVYRSALVGVGSPGSQTPVLVCQPWDEHWPWLPAGKCRLLDSLFERSQGSPLTEPVRRQHIFLRRRLPVDIRHNSKIFREQLAIWAAKKVRG